MKNPAKIRGRTKMVRPLLYCGFNYLFSTNLIS